MNSDLNKFGGWLKFFYILFWLNLSFSVLSLLGACYLYLFPNAAIENFSYTILDLIIKPLSLLSVIYILFVFKQKAPKTVIKLTIAITILIFINIAYSLANYYLYNTPLPKFISFTLPVIFLLYIYSSKRAATYYVRTVELKKIIEKEELSIAFANGIATKSLVSIIFISIIMFIIWLFL